MVIIIGNSLLLIKENKPKTNLKRVITQAYIEFKQRHGNLRLTIELNGRGYKILKTTVTKYMKKL